MRQRRYHHRAMRPGRRWWWSPGTSTWPQRHPGAGCSARGPQSAPDPEPAEAGSPVCGTFARHPRPVFPLRPEKWCGAASSCTPLFSRDVFPGSNYLKGYLEAARAVRATRRCARVLALEPGERLPGRPAWAAGDELRATNWTGVQLGHEKDPPMRICWKAPTSGSELKTRTASIETPNRPKLYGVMLPEPFLRVIVPTGLKSRVTHSCVPSGRFTFLTPTDRTLKPPQPLNCVSSAMAVPLGVWPLNDGPLSASFSFPPVWQPRGLGAGGPVTVSENVPVAVAPAASVTVTVNVDVPVVAGAPSSSPEDRSVNPAGGCPEKV